MGSYASKSSKAYSSHYLGIMLKLFQCIPIKSFGKRHMDEIMPDIKTIESVAHWCTVHTRTGSLTCVLDSDHCFDAEIYMDELYSQDDVDIREDQRSKLLLINNNLFTVIDLGS